MTGLRRRQLLAGSMLLPLALGPHRGSAKASPHVVIVGGGFAGATAARYLARWLPEVRISLLIGRNRYYTCPFSNLAVIGERSLTSLEVGREQLATDRVSLIRLQARDFDPHHRRLRLEDGRLLHFDRLILAPGIEVLPESIEGHGPEHVATFPHAWQAAGPATDHLARRLQAVPDGGLVIVSVPEAPYRCPPGPYERASLMAWWLAHHRPRSKLIILDANEAFTKDDLFKAHWREAHPQRLSWLGRGDDGRLRRVDAGRGSVHTDFADFQPDLACVIPPQRAGAIARSADLDGGRGWCSVDPRSFASTVHPNVHVIGDAAIANPMPKSAFAAASQARICAAAIAAEFSGRQPPESLLTNTCYSLLTPTAAIAVTGSYRGTADGIETLPGSSGTSPLDAPDSLRRAEAGHARGWYASARADAFGE
ncbi:MAG: FAD-dependent oxidoreductase [Gammaproteobacteria bacterium]|nr:FAD-dependent oxidoreductase [Gammaproteobacteria bacterium]